MGPTAFGKIRGQQDKNNKKRGSTRSKIMEENGTKCFKNGQITDLTLGQIISVTKCDRDKPIFLLQKSRVNKIKLGIKRDPMEYENVKKGGESRVFC